MKKIKGAVIGAGKDAIHTIIKAQEYSIYVAAMDGNPMAEGLKYADEPIVADISDLDRICQIIEQIKPDFIIPVPIGRYLTTAGYINEKYNMKGIKFDAANISTDKYLFHKELNAKGLRPVKLFLINKETDILKLPIEYPAILKPRFGSGSRAVFYISSFGELKEAIKTVKSLEEDFVLEQAVDGEEYSIDGAVVNGKLIITLLRKKIITPLPIRQPVASFSVVKTQENQKLLHRVRNYLQAVFSQLNYDCCLINADLIINNDEVFIIEAAPRPSGHNLHNIFVPIATGIDLAEEYLKLLLEEKYCFEPNDIRCVQIHFFDFEEIKLKKVPSLKELNESGRCSIIHWSCNIVPGQYMNRVTNGHSIMDRGFFIVEGKNEQDLRSQSNWILSQFE